MILTRSNLVEKFENGFDSGVSDALARYLV